MPCAPRSASATWSSTARATARASRSRTRRGTPTACARSCSTAALARWSSAATATQRPMRSRGRSARTSPSSRGWLRGCAPVRCTSTAVSTTTSSRAWRPCETRARSPSCRPPRLPPCAASRAAGATGGRRRARRRAPGRAGPGTPVTTTPRPLPHRSTGAAHPRDPAAPLGRPPARAGGSRRLATVLLLPRRGRRARARAAGELRRPRPHRDPAQVASLPPGGDYVPRADRRPARAERPARDARRPGPRVPAGARAREHRVCAPAGRPSARSGARSRSHWRPRPRRCATPRR